MFPSSVRNRNTVKFQVRSHRPTKNWILILILDDPVTLSCTAAKLQQQQQHNAVLLGRLVFVLFSPAACVLSSACCVSNFHSANCFLSPTCICSHFSLLSVDHSRYLSPCHLAPVSTFLQQWQLFHFYYFAQTYNRPDRKTQPCIDIQSLCIFFFLHFSKKNVTELILEDFSFFFKPTFFLSADGAADPERCRGSPTDFPLGSVT